MWMAEGFMSVEYDGEGEETMEDVAERYLNELVGRCVVEVGKKDCTGRVKTCRLHDLMRDVCLSKAKEESLIHSYERDVVTKDLIRRLSLIGFKDIEEEVSLSGYEAYSHIIRSLVIRTSHILPLTLAVTFELLKMLLLERIEMRHMKDLSEQIAKLIHLRYLSLRGCWIYDWPSLEKLGCMETLDLRVQCVESKLPLKIGEIWKMKELRHFYLPHIIGYSTDGDDIPIESNLNLHTLVNFPPPNHKVGEILTKFPYLRKLRLRAGEHMIKLWETLNNNKDFSLGRLRSFSLRSWNPINENVDLKALLAMCPHLYKLRLAGPIPEFPHLKQFPTKLTMLLLMDSRNKDPEHIRTTLGNLPHLRSLSLGEDSFKGEQLSFKKHTFLQLTALKLFNLEDLKTWTVEEGAMPKLERLEIDHVSKLEAVPQGLRFIATLKELQISYMPAEFEARLKKGGADFDTVKHVPSITFKGWGYLTYL